MEAAAFLSDKAKSVSVVGKSSVPFQAVLGSEIGTLAMKVNANVSIYSNSALVCKVHKVLIYV